MLGLDMTMLRPDRGVFPNGMTYARLGEGPKTLLWLASGTKGPMLAMMTRAVRPFVADGYSVCLVSGDRTCRPATRWRTWPTTTPP